MDPFLSVVASAFPGRAGIFIRTGRSHIGKVKCSLTKKSLVQIKDVTFNNIRGTSNSLVAVNFNCSSSLPCQKINLNDIKLITDNNAKPTIASCANAIGQATGIELPPSCLKPVLESST
ncbi:hypothetical protein MTR67_000885 [Solanum verrucosum]|uniref:Polygalacturonase n=1 Tax=Solanum verrucosum TaxID=315347 RepID=A0AAF0PQS8_SOLVR|nr:hypothetical protein MTR67_000885 [Solanum verrucosum]